MVKRRAGSRSDPGSSPARATRATRSIRFFRFDLLKDALILLLVQPMLARERGRESVHASSRMRMQYPHSLVRMHHAHAHVYSMYVAGRPDTAA